MKQDEQFGREVWLAAWMVGAARSWMVGSLTRWWVFHSDSHVFKDKRDFPFVNFCVPEEGQHAFEHNFRELAHWQHCTCGGAQWDAWSRTVQRYVSPVWPEAWRSVAAK